MQEQLNIYNILEVSKFQTLMDDFYSLTKVPCSLIDTNNKIIISSGWKEIYYLNHHVENKATKQCLNSNYQHLCDFKKKTMFSFTAENYLSNIYQPLFIDNLHIATVHLGQFRYSEDIVSKETLINFVHKNKLDYNTFIEAYKETPQLSKEQIGKTIKYFAQITEILIHSSHSNYKLEKEIERKKIIENELLISKKKAEENERTIKNVINAIPDLFFYKNVDGVYKSCNEKFGHFADKTPNELIGCTDYDLFPVNMADMFRLNDKEMMKQEKARINEERVTYPDGKERYLQTVKTPFYNKNKELQGIIGISRDITEIKKAQLHLIEKNKKIVEVLKKTKENEEKNRFLSNDLMQNISFKQELLNSISLPVFYKDKKGKYLGCNKAFETYFKLTEDNIVGKSVFDLFPDEKAQMFHAKDIELYENSKYQKYEAKIINGHGEARDVIYSKNIFLDEENEIAGLVGTLTDISLIKEHERTLNFEKQRVAESEEKFKLAFYTSPDSININKLDGTYVEINNGFTKLTGYTENEVIGSTSKNINIWANPKDREKLICNLKNDGFVENMETEFRLKNGIIKTGLMSAVLIPINNEKHILSITRDVSLRKELEVKQQESEQKYKAIFNESSEGIAFINRDMEILDCNQSFSKIVKIAKVDLMKMTPCDFKEIYWHTNEKRKDFLNALTNGKPIKSFEDELKIDNNIISVYINIKQIKLNDVEYYMMAANDISERKNLDKKLFHTMTSAEELERERYAKELHDGLSPLLSTCLIYLNAIQKKDDKIQINEFAQLATDFIKEGLASIKEISNNLSPTILKKFGLVHAVRAFIEKLNLISEIRFKISSNLKCILDELTEITLYRVVVELVNNSLKYSRASMIEISFNNIDNILEVTFEDNGIGFDYHQVKNLNKGFGLVNLENRISKINGEYEYKSSPNKGVNVYIKVKKECND